MHETEQEAEQLWLEAVDPWEPHPDELYVGRVVRAFKGYAFAELENGSKVFISQSDVILEAGHRCLHPGDDVVLRLRKSAPGRSTKWDARECWLQQPREMPTEATGVVDRFTKSGRVVFVGLDCGCYTAGRVDDEPLLVGDAVSLADFVPSRDKKNEGNVFARTVKRIAGHGGAQ